MEKIKKGLMFLMFMAIGIVLFVAYWFALALTIAVDLIQGKGAKEATRQWNLF